jgi:hypothetical protein
MIALILFYQLLRSYIENEESLPIPPDLLSLLIAECSNHPAIYQALLAQFSCRGIPIAQYTNFSFLWEIINGRRVLININDIAIENIINNKTWQEFDRGDLLKYYQLYANWYYTQLLDNEQSFYQDFLEFIMSLNPEEIQYIYNRPDADDEDDDDEDDNDDDDADDDDDDADDADDDDDADERHVRPRDDERRVRPRQ